MGASLVPAAAVIDPTASIVAQVLAEAAAGDAAAAAAATRPLLRTPCPADAVIRILGAALDLDDARFVRAAAALAMAADMPIPRRIHAAWRLAIAGKGEPALAVLLADPQVLASTGRMRQIIVTLQETQARSGPGTLAHQQARALIQRLLPAATPPAIRSEHRFAGDASAAPQVIGARVMFHATPAAAAVTRAEIEAVHAEFERQLPKVRHPEVSVWPGVFVNRHGQVWTPEGKLYRSYGRPIPEASRAAEATAPRLADAAFAVEAHNNVFHWLAEWFPTLAWCLDDPAGAMPLLIRDDAAPFVAQSLELGAAGRLDCITTGDAVFVERLHCSDRGLALMARREAVGGLMDRLRGNAMARSGAASSGRPVYISRRDSTRRRLLNEPQLEAALRQRGFDIVQMTPLSFAEQIARIARAPRVISAHGAGLTLMATAYPDRQVIEMMPAMRGSMLVRSTMAKISRIMGHRHHVWLQEVPAVAESWSVSLDPFLALVDSLADEPPLHPLREDTP